MNLDQACLFSPFLSESYGQAVDLKVQESIRLLVFQKFKKAYL